MEKKKGGLSKFLQDGSAPGLDPFLNLVKFEEMKPTKLNKLVPASPEIKRRLKALLDSSSAAGFEVTEIKMSQEGEITLSSKKEKDNQSKIEDEWIG